MSYRTDTANCALSGQDTVLDAQICLHLRGIQCTDRDESVIKGAGDYWEKCFTLCEPVPQFLQPVVDKVGVAMVT